MSESRINVPEDIAQYLEIENCEDFEMGKYYLNSQQVGIYNDIIRMRTITKEMQNMGLEYLNTTLLYGPTGSGKTTFARCIAHNLELDFAYINFAKLVGGILGDTSQKISKIFRFMANNECLFMLDEIDCIATDRTSESSATGGELSRITITIMQELDYYKKHQVKSIIMAATNVPEKLDPALRSRFAIEKEIGLLINKDKEGFIIKYLNYYDIPFDRENVRDYVARNSQVTQRRIESDMLRAIAAWISNEKEGNIFLESIKNY